MVQALAVDVVVRRWEPSDGPAVWAVIDSVWSEFGSHVPSSTIQDLADIERAYVDDASGFWVATDKGQIIGTIALKAIGDGSYTLKRMYVLRTHRGTGVARLLLQETLAFARAHGGKTIYLGTAEEAVASQRFYDKNGFDRIGPESLPAGFFRSPEDTRFYKRALGAA